MSGSSKAGYVCALRRDACALARPTLRLYINVYVPVPGVPERSRLIMQLRAITRHLGLESDATRCDSHQCDFAPLFVYQYRREGTISGDIRMETREKTKRD